MTNSLQSASDFSQLPLTFGTKVDSYNIEILSMDIDPVNNIILVLGTRSDSTGTIKREQFFALFDENTYMLQNIYYYDALAGLPLNFQVDKLQMDAETAKDIIAWTSSGLNPRIIKIQRSTMEVKQILKVTNSQYVQKLLVNVDSVFSNLNVVIYYGQGIQSYKVCRYDLDNTTGSFYYQMIYEKEITTTSSSFFHPTAIIYPSNLDCMVLTGIYESNGPTYRYAFAMLEMVTATGSWNSGGGSGRIDYRLLNSATTNLANNLYGDVVFDSVTLLTFACFVIPSGVNFNPAAIATTITNTGNFNVYRYYEFQNSLISTPGTQCTAIRVFSNQLNLFGTYTDTNGQQQLFRTYATYNVAYSGTPTTQIYSRFRQGSTYPRSFKIFLKPSSPKVYTYGYFKQQLDCTYFPANVAQLYGMVNEAQSTLACMNAQSSSTSNAGGLLIDTSVSILSGKHDYATTSTTLFQYLTFKLSAFTDDIINVDRHCEYIGAPIYPNQTFQMGLIGTQQTVAVPKHKLNGQISDSCNLNLQYGIGIVNNDGGFTTNLVEYNSNATHFFVTFTLGPSAVNLYYQCTIFINNYGQQQNSQGKLFLVPFCGTPPASASYTYRISEPEQVIQQSDFYLTIPACTMRFSVSNVSPANTFTAPSSAIKVDLATSTLKIYSATNGLTGLFKFDLLAETDYNSYGTITIYIDIQPKPFVFVPVFAPLPPPTLPPEENIQTEEEENFEELPDSSSQGPESLNPGSSSQGGGSFVCKIYSIKVKVQDVYTQSIPDCILTKSEELDAVIDLDLSPIKSFTTFKNNKLTYRPQSRHVGSYLLSLVFRDSRFKPIGKAYKFKVQVIKGEPPKENACSLGPLEKCHPRMLQVSADGMVNVVFPAGIQGMNETEYGKVGREMNFTYVKSQSNDKSNSTIIGWKVTKLSNKEINVQLTFTNPIEISLTKDLDQLVMNFVNASYFQSLDKLYFIPKNLTLQSEISPQKVNSTLMKMVEKAFSLVDSSLQSGIVVNLVLGIVLGASMKRMWALINTLQILTHLPLLGFVLPTNLKICLTMIVQISSLNIVPQAWVDYIVNFIQSTKADIQSERSDGFEKNAFVKNIGFILVTVMGLCGLIAFMVLLGLLSKRIKLIQKVFILLKNKLLFGAVLSYYLKSYLKLYINALQGTQVDSSVSNTESQHRLLQNRQLSEENEQGSNSQMTAYALTIFMSVTPFLVYLGLYFNRGKLEDQTFAIRYNTLYQNLKTGLRIPCVLYSFLYLTRRMIYALCIMFMSDSPAIQLFIQVLMSLGQLGYTLVYQPFEEKSDNIVEIANEGTVLMVLTVLLGYTDGQVEPLVGSNIGFMLVGIILFSVLINVVLFLIATVKLLYVKGFRPLLEKWRKRQLENAKKSQLNETQMNLKITETQQTNGSPMKLDNLELKPLQIQNAIEAKIKDFKLKASREALRKESHFTPIVEQQQENVLQFNFAERKATQDLTNQPESPYNFSEMTKQPSSQQLFNPDQAIQFTQNRIAQLMMQHNQQQDQYNIIPEYKQHSMHQPEQQDTITQQKRHLLPFQEFCSGL